MNFPHTINIQRLTENAGQSLFTALSTGIVAFIQPLDIETSDMLNENFSKSSYAFLPITTDIKQGDRIIWGAFQYDVKGVKQYRYGNLTHQKALLEEL